MCVAENSVDLYTSTCPMCKFFRNSARCPHKRETCRNRVNHPRHDVRYIVNAEVTTFKGCGYCKWATQTNPPPPPNKSGMLNPGWPGCCRPPASHELDKIPPADWPAVNAVHRTPIPPEIKQLLDSLKMSAGSPPNTISPTSPTSSYLKDVSNKTLERDRDRKNGSRISGSPNGTVRTHIQKNRPSVPMVGGGGSSPSKQARFGGSGTPPTGSIAGSADTPNGNSNSVRRAGHAEAHIPLNRIEGFRTTPPGTTRKLCSEDHQNQARADSPQRSPTLVRTSKEGGFPTARTSPTLLPKDSEREREVSSTASNVQQPQLKRRDSAVKSPQVQVVPAKSASSLSKASAKPSYSDIAPKATDRDRERQNGDAGLEKALKSLKITTDATNIPAPPSAVSSNGSDTSSDGGSRSSEGTVTSDGGFTDYLSDESDAELQRQAEVRAAILEQNRQEDNEFRLARKQLATIDLKPPVSWTTGVTRKAINTGYMRGN